PVAGDWTGTGSAQMGIFDPSTTLSWKLDRNGNDLWDGCTVDLCLGPFGQASDLPVVGRWQAGSIKDMIGVYRPSTGVWFFDNGNGVWDGCNADRCLGPFGTSSQVPVVGDWASTGASQLGTFDSGTGQWKLDLNGNGVFDGCSVDACLGPFGLPGDRPVVGDWTGTGTIKIGVFDPSTGLWDLDRNGNGV